MKKRKRPAARKPKKSRRKPIMRHSREGARSGKRRAKTVRKAKKAKRTAKRTTAKKTKKAKRPATRRTKPARAKAARGREPVKVTRRPRGPAGASFEPLPDERGTGAEAGGQSGDTEGLSRWEEADSESVEELIEEGQAFEAGIVGGVEDAPDADRGEIRTREVPEDDVPEEYLDDERPGR